MSQLGIPMANFSPVGWVTFRRQKFLTDDDYPVWLREAIIKTRGRYPFTIDAWVLLPDHLHCIWTLPKQLCRVHPTHRDHPTPIMFDFITDVTQ